MSLFERLLAVDPARLLELGQRPAPRVAQRPVDQVARTHGEPRVLDPEPSGQAADDLVIRPAVPRRIDQLRPEQDMLLAAGLVDIVMLDETWWPAG